jgi:hypothetical protein
MADEDLEQRKILIRQARLHQALSRQRERNEVPSLIKAVTEVYEIYGIA